MCEWRRRSETPKRYEIWDPQRQEDSRPRKDRLVPKHPNMRCGPQALRKEDWMANPNLERRGSVPKTYNVQ